MSKRNAEDMLGKAYTQQKALEDDFFRRIEDGNRVPKTQPSSNICNFRLEFCSYPLHLRESTDESGEYGEEMDGEDIMVKMIVNDADVPETARTDEHGDRFSVEVGYILAVHRRAKK
jgi:hypothetical protein